VQHDLRAHEGLPGDRAARGYERGSPNAVRDRATAEEMLDAVPLSATPPTTVASEDQGICEVEVALLRHGPGVRSDGVDESYAKLLASVVTPLPPIAVDSQTMVVLDGVHRVRAAVLRQETFIRARYVSGSESELLIMAVQANAAHGRPLSLTDRKDAAGRLLSLAPDMSDRAVAEIDLSTGQGWPRSRTSQAREPPGWTERDGFGPVGGHSSARPQRTASLGGSCAAPHRPTRIHGAHKSISCVEALADRRRISREC
jgi:hypothetical protein